MSLDDALPLIDEAQALAVVIMSPSGIHRRAFEIASQFGMKWIYDAFYVALAEIVGCDLWTADETLHAAVSEAHTNVRLLSEYPLTRPSARDTQMSLRAVLFDVGGPINTEIEHERRVDVAIRAALAAEGIAAGDEEYAAASAWAVEHFAPDAHTAIIWRLTRRDAELSARAYAAFRDAMHEWPAFELRDGIGDVLAWLHGRGLRLGLAANQPHATLVVLDEHGIGQYFHHREVSGTHGFRKPDVRLFLRCCEDLGAEPDECVMVGDRIDNDIAPARMLGMRTVLFRTGRHAMQQPRSADEVPDADVRDVAELRAALELLLGSAP